MPKRPPRMCAKQWCSKHAEQGYYCLDHQPVRTDERLSAHKRGYDSSWTNFRAVYLRQHPVCARCGRAANVVHHIIPLEDGGDKYDDGNLEALCRICHEIHHGRAKCKEL